MIDTVAHIKKVLALGSSAGDEAVPIMLVQLLAEQSSPLTSVFDHAMANEIYGALQEEFGFLQVVRMTGKPPNDQAMNRLAALYRWVVRQLREWTTDADPRNEKLIAILVTTNLFDGDSLFWSSLPQEFDNPALFAALEKLIGHFGTSFSTRGLGQPPIWESELIELFQTADKQQDWKTVVDLWRRIENPWLGNSFVTQVVRCLCSFAFDRLVAVLQAVKSTPSAVQLLSGLSAEQRFRLALGGGNPYLDLTATYLSLYSHFWAKPLSEADTAQLAQLLERTANDIDLWSKWMAAFNYYPQPNLQPALGRALASVPDAAVQVYVESLHLTPLPLRNVLSSARGAVASCLSIFRGCARPERQRLLWTLAHERWRQWRFDATDKNTHLFECTFSPLDYAVVGYACECMTDAEREAAIAELFNELKNLSDVWHESVTDFTSAWSRLISLFQPYAHARTIAETGGDWLVSDRVYFFYDPNTDYYLTMLSGMRANA
jgi:hypothetical protein